MKLSLARLLDRLSGNARALSTMLREPSYARIRKSGGDRELFSLLARPWLNRSRIRAVIDVGANEGQAALTFRALFPQAEIHSFEPQPEPCRRITQRFADDQRFHLHPIACGATATRMPLHVSEFSPASSFLKSCVQGEGDETPLVANAGFLDVQVERLDSYVALQKLPPGPWLLKLDVQGFELEVLRGAQGLFSNVEVIVCEVLLAAFYEGQTKAEDLLAFLRDHGFLPIDFDEPVRTVKSGKVLYLDVAFARATGGENSNATAASGRPQ